ncbi:MAG: hypothetical protein ACKOAU_01955, partial [Pirellula sp.]
GENTQTRNKQTVPFEIQPLDPAASPPSATVAAPSDWQSPRAKARRQLLTLLVVGLSGCLLAGLAFKAFLNNWQQSNRVENTIGNQPVVADNNAAIANPADPIAPVANPDAPPELIVDAGPNVGANQPIAPKAPADPMEPVAQAAPGLKVNPLGVPPENIPAENAMPQEPQSPKSSIQENSLKPNPGQPQSPALPSGQDLATSPPADENLPSIFKDFLPVFDRSSQPGWTDLGREGEKTIDRELALENSEVTFATEYFPQPIPLPNWTERSERKLGRIRTAEMSIPRIVHWINNLSGHAISIDWFLFNLSDIPLDQPQVFQSEGTTLGGMLDEFKARIGAETDIDAKGFVTLRPAANKLSTKLKPDGSSELGPLSKGLPEGQDQAVLKLVLDMLQIDGCEYKDGKLLWGPNANAYQQAQALAALASIREAIAKEPANESNSIFDFNRPAAWTKLYRQSQTKLAADEILYEERPIVDILTRAAHSSQSEMLIDWPAVWSHGLHPNRMALSLLRGRNLLEVSNRFLDDHSLELVPLDSKTWMLTTETQRRSMIRLVAVRTDRGVSLEDMRVLLRGLVPRNQDGKSMFIAANVPGADGVALLRLCPPNSNLLGDEDLLRALGQVR